MKKIITLVLLSVVTPLFAQETSPKLVVGIVVDQLRHEYLYRFENKFGQEGFKRMMRDGFTLNNAHYNYVPTYTGPGHASIFTGTTPAYHGIIGNDWYEKSTKKMVNCVDDDRYKAVGFDSPEGNVSPSRMITTTITDELKLFTQYKSKVVGMSIKDRGAVLPAGHNPDGAYWYDSRSGMFITSTYYIEKLPNWVDQFNGKKLADNYLNQDWKTSFPISEYTESGPDDSPYEVKYRGTEKSTMPYKFSELRKQNGEFAVLPATPFGNELLTQFAMSAVKGEALGKDGITDFLTVSYSSPDYIGHAMGPNAVEVEDTYIKLDKNLEELFKYLDKEVGVNQYTVFLTSDHGVADVPQSLTDNKMPAGYFRVANVEAGLKFHLKKYFPDKEIIERIYNDQVFLNHEQFSSDPKSSGVELMIASQLISEYLMSVAGVAQVYTESTIRQGDYDEGGVKGMLVRGFNHKRSGDIAYVLEPGWISWGGIQGTTHGSPYTYDTHIPILFFGKGIKKGSSSVYHRITDIAPTLSVLLKIKFPNGCTGQPIGELFD